MHPVKRPRTSSPQLDRAARSAEDAPVSAASAIQDSIALLASSGLPPALFSKLLTSLATAHASVVQLEEELSARKKNEEDKAAVEVGQQGNVAAREPPKEQRWWTASLQVQGELSVVARCVLRDLEDGMPALDQLPDLDSPAATDPYHMAKYQPEKFRARIRDEAHARRPTAPDLVDLAEANRRATERLDRFEAQQA
ncbi:hypothetical protein JCM1840_006610 [Sporobolomyces johnsonii]